MDENVFELPRIFEVEVFVGEFVLMVLKGIPISVVPSDGTDVWLLDVEAEFVVHIVSLHIALVGVG
jgi:hypothetical protein